MMKNNILFSIKLHWFFSYLYLDITSWSCKKRRERRIIQRENKHFRAGEAAAAAAASELWGAGGSAQAVALPRGGGAQVDGKRVPAVLPGTAARVSKTRGAGSDHVAETTCQATPVAESQQPQHHQQLDPNRGWLFLACRHSVFDRADPHRSF